MKASRMLTTGMILAAVLLAACQIDGTTDRSWLEATPTPESADPIDDHEPDLEITPPPEQTPEPAPTPVPTGGYLLIDQLRATQVLIHDIELGAEYAATQYRLYRRGDSRSWQLVSELPKQGRFVVAPSDPEVIYHGDHPPCLHDAEPVPFHRSLDGGVSWERIETADNTRPLIVLPEDPTTVIGSRCGVAISTDGGSNWEIHYPATEFDLTSLSTTPIGLYGIFTSEGGTSHLHRINLDDPENPEFDEPILEFWGNGDVHATQRRMYVAEPRGVHLSDDGGRTWVFTREGLEDVTLSVDPRDEALPDDEAVDRRGVLTIRAHPVESSRVFAGTAKGLYLSEDRGETWGRISEMGEERITGLDFGIGGNILYATTQFGIIVLNNP